MISTNQFLNQPTLNRTQSYRNLVIYNQTLPNNNTLSLNHTKENNINLLNIRLSKLQKNDRSSTNTSVGSLRSQKYQKMIAKKQNLSREMQKKQAYLIQQNRPLMKRKQVISPLNVENMNHQKIQTDYGKIIINQQGFIKISYSNDPTHKNIIFKISSKGYKITIKKDQIEKIYNLNELPQKYISLYKYCKDIIKLIKSNTPKIKLQIKGQAKLIIMENSTLSIEIGKNKFQSIQSVPKNLQSKYNLFKWYQVVLKMIK